MIFDIIKRSIIVFMLLTIDCVNASMESNTEHAVIVDGFSQPVIFSSCCRGAKGGNRFSFSMYGEYMGYEFNRTNYYGQTGARAVDKSDKYDVIVTKLPSKHLKYFDLIELWHLRSNHKLFQIVLNGKPSGGLSVSECHELYQSITNELDYCFNVRMIQRPSTMAPNLLYDADGSVPGFSFSVRISRTDCRMTISALRVLSCNKKSSTTLFGEEVKVDTNGL